MAVDAKYGKVTMEHGTVGEDEPVVVCRAQDKLLPQMLEAYHAMCAGAGSPQRHLDLIASTREQVLEWQKEHLVKVPDSESSRAWLPEAPPVQQEVNRLRDELHVRDFPG
jgi:hypothetical protein